MKRLFSFFVIWILVFSMSACNSGAGRSDGESSDGSAVENSDAAAVPFTPTAAPSSQEAGARDDAAAPLQISVRAGEHTTVFALNDSGAAAELYAQLPLQVEVENYSSNEKIFYPPQRLGTADTPLAGADVQAGTLAYYEPWGDVVLFYDSFAAANGLYELGQAISGAEYIAAMSGTVEIAPHIPSDPAGQGGKTLLVYFSHTGTTGAVAEAIAQAAEMDMLEIVPLVPYPADYNENLSVARSELDGDARPAIEQLPLDLDGYDTILLGYPIWHGTFPMPVATFLESWDFTGKRIAPFCTSGSTSINGSVAHIAELAPDAEVLQGLGIASSALDRTEELVVEWLEGLGLM